MLFILLGLIAADGSINWDCPCLGGMASGPCGVDFREAFSCFHYSKADPKGSVVLDFSFNVIDNSNIATICKYFHTKVAQVLLGRLRAFSTPTSIH